MHYFSMDLVADSTLIDADRSAALPEFGIEITGYHATYESVGGQVDVYAYPLTELEKEAGASREDWQEIASVVGHHTTGLVKEVTKAAKDAEESGDLAAAKADTAGEPAASNVVSIDAGQETDEEEPEEDEPDGDAAAEPEEDKPWFVPEPTRRRRTSSK